MRRTAHSWWVKPRKPAGLTPLRDTENMRLTGMLARGVLAGDGRTNVIMKLELLEDLYRKALAQLADAERQMLRVLPKMAEAVSAAELSQLFDTHASETETQLQRLGRLKTSVAGPQLKSKAMAGLIAEVKDLIADGGSDPQLRDAAMIAAGQKIEAFEITSYACAHNFARLLGFHDDLATLEASFREEEKMEEVLSGMAEALSLEEIESREVLTAPTPPSARK